MRLLLPLLILLLSGYSASSQVTSVCIPAAQAAKVVDSLRVLPVVREEAQSWRLSSAYYRQAADSLRQADAASQRAITGLKSVLADQGTLLADQKVQTADWKQKARRRGLVNYVLIGLAVAGWYLSISH